MKFELEKVEMVKSNHKFMVSGSFVPEGDKETDDLKELKSVLGELFEGVSRIKSLKSNYTFGDGKVGLTEVPFNAVVGILNAFHGSLGWRIRFDYNKSQFVPESSKNVFMFECNQKGLR